MIKVSKASKREALDEEWRLLDHIHYGKTLEWIEKNLDLRRWKTEN